MVTHLENRLVYSIASVFMVILFAVFVLGFVGCSGGSEQSNEELQPSGSEVEMDDDEFRFTIENVVENGDEGLWAESADTGEVEEVLTTYGWATYEYELIDDMPEDLYQRFVSFHLGQEWTEPKPDTTVTLYEIASDDYPLISKSSGDRLLVTSTCEDIDDSNIAEIYCTGYCQGQDIAGDAYETIEENDASDLRYNEKKLRNLEKALNVFCVSEEGAQRFYYCSPASQVFSAAWYEGTEYVEGRLPLETPYALEGDTIGSIDFKKTKDGYLEINTDDLQPGTYSFLLHQNESPWYIGHVVRIEE